MFRRTRICALLLLLITCACGTPSRAEPPNGTAMTIDPRKLPADVPVDIREHRGRPMIHIDGKPLANVIYAPINYENFNEQVDRFVAHDMNVYMMHIGKLAVKPGDFFATRFWVGDTITDSPTRNEQPGRVVSIDDQAKKILEADPDAWLMLRFYCFEPQSWRELHPDQLFVNEQGKTIDTPSYASDLYWRDSARYVAAIVKYVQNQPWGHRVIGFSNYMRHEGNNGAVIEGWIYDHSDIMQRRWRTFLRERYKTDAALQQAWDDASVTLDTAAVPRDHLRAPLRKVSQSPFWQTGTKMAPYHDYIALQTQLFHTGMRTIMKAGREASKWDRVFLYDALKQPMAGWDNYSFFHPNVSAPYAYHDMMIASGSTRATDLFDAEGFDGLQTPHDYQARGLGGIYLPEGMADSTILRGKYFLTEMDQRTWTGKDKDRYGAARNMKEFDALVWRNVATSLAHGYASYYMDLFTDWYADPAVHPTVSKQVAVLKQAVNWDHDTQPGIAMILDDTAYRDTNGNGAYENLAVMWAQKTGLARCGVPYRIYMLSDLERDDFPPHRVYYFPNLFRLTDERLALLKRAVFKDGHVVLWGPGSGSSDGKTLSHEHAAKLTGFTFNELVRESFARRTLITNFDHAITRDLDEGDILGDTLPYGPMLFPTDGTKLGEAWTREGRLMTGLAVKEFGTGDAAWSSVFTTALPLPANLWRGLARHAGAHIYTDSNDVIIASKGIVALHSVRSGKKTITLPHPSTVYDLVKNEKIGDSVDHITFTLDAPATHVFRVVPVEGD